MEEEDYDDEEEEGDEEAVRPASEESIMGLEVVRIEEGSVDLAGEACAVCLNEFSIGSEARRMPCSHTYHQDCIVQWLGRSNMCPMCRYSSLEFMIQNMVALVLCPKFPRPVEI
uniref:RING-type E3 ubiquitin transferase n=1 Tax=Quercus lobata TaxID=97700 RepID=A0A7N2N3S9_QUELO